MNSIFPSAFQDESYLNQYSPILYTFSYHSAHTGTIHHISNVLISWRNDVLHKKVKEICLKRALNQLAKII